MRKEGVSTVDIKNEIAGKEHEKGRNIFFLCDEPKKLYLHSLNLAFFNRETSCSGDGRFIACLSFHGIIVCEIANKGFVSG